MAWCWSGRVGRSQKYSELVVNPDFHSSIKVTIVFSILSTIGVMVTALLMGLAASRKRRSDEPLRAIWFLPAIAPATAMAVFWTISVQPEIGVVTQLMGKIGLGRDSAWLSEPSTALYVVIAVSIWASASFPFLLIVGAIDRIDPEVLEAAKVDGAGEWQQNRFFILPLIQPVLVVVTVLQFIWSFNGFSLIWAMTRGGPVDSTSVLSIFQYKQAFMFGDFGTASAVGVLERSSCLLSECLVCVSQNLERLSNEAQQYCGKRDLESLSDFYHINNPFPILLYYSSFI